MRVLLAAVVLAVLAIPVLAGGAPPQSGMVLGNVWIDADEHSVRIAVDRHIGPYRADGIPDDEFILWTELVAGRVIHDEIEGVIVRFWPEKVVLLSRKDGRALLLAMSGAPEEKGPTLDEVRADTRGNNLALEEFTGGYGLTIRTDLTLPYDELQREWERYNHERFGIRTSDVHVAVICASGGCGSVSCSYSCDNGSCSVTCNSTSYSCCGCVFKTAICACEGYPCR